MLLLTRELGNHVYTIVVVGPATYFLMIYIECIHNVMALTTNEN